MVRQVSSSRVWRVCLLGATAMALAGPTLVAAPAMAAGGGVTGSGFAQGATPRATHAAKATGDGFLGIANGVSGTFKSIAAIAAGILVVCLVAWAIVERSVKSVLVAGVLSILAAMVISGQFWSASQSTASQISQGAGK